MRLVSARIRWIAAIAILTWACRADGLQSSYSVGADGDVVGAPAQGAPPTTQSGAQPQGGPVVVTDPNTGAVYTLPPGSAIPPGMQPVAGSAVTPGGPAGAMWGQSGAQPQSAATSANSYVPWQDPAEGAFTVSLPAGWQISGGTVRTTQIEPHYVIHAQSPDGGVQMFMDDPSILIREIPVPALERMGMREGGVISSPWGGRLLVERYIPAPATAQQYAQQRLCPSASQFRGGIIPGQTQALNQQMGAIAQAAGKQIHVDVGEVSFKCGAENGYVYAITLQAWQPGGQVSLWLIYRIAGYLSATQESAQAADAMQTMLGTFQMDQGWLQRFAQQANDVAGENIRESNAVTQSTIERSQQMQAAEESQFHSWQQNQQTQFNAIEGTNHAITGNNSGGGGGGNGHDYNAQLDQKTVCNDAGTCKKVDATVDNWWSDCSG